MKDDLLEPDGTMSKWTVLLFAIIFSVLFLLAAVVGNELYERRLEQSDLGPGGGSDVTDFDRVGHRTVHYVRTITPGS